MTRQELTTRDGTATLRVALGEYDTGWQQPEGSRDRAAVSATIPPALLALYDRAAVRSSGAALLRRGTCEGCNMVLAGTDLQALRQASVDDIVTCPECGCILVRAEDSGL